MSVYTLVHANVQVYIRIAVDACKHFVNHCATCPPPNRQHQPLYPYKYQKPSSPSVFWPGALLNKLRVCLDSNQKTNTMRNIFQPVREETTSSSVKPAVCSWPQNEAGYVQFGTIQQKRCAL